MIDSVDSKKQLSTAKPLVKGFNFYKSGNVHSIHHLKPTTSPTKALADVLQYNKQYQSFAMNQGLEKEEEIERL